MCTGRVDMAFVLRALSKGAAGALIIGCHINECNYATQGNLYALSMVSLCKQLLLQISVNPERLRMELISGGEAPRFAEMVNSFIETVRRLGPLGAAEKIDKAELTCRLEALTKLVPYIKIQKRDKLQARFRTREEYDTLYSSDEIHRLLHEVTSYYINPDTCQACSICAKRCPVGAISGGKDLVHIIDQEKCIKCGCCFQVCPARFGAVTKLTGEPVPPPISEDKRAIVRAKKKAG